MSKRTTKPKAKPVSKPVLNPLEVHHANVDKWLADATISLKDLQRARTRRRRELRGLIDRRRSLADALTTTTTGPIPEDAVLTPRADDGHDPPAPEEPRRTLKLYRED